MEQDVLDFLEQSNFIEGVTDADSLDQAIHAWRYLMEQPELTTGVVLKTHKVLMLHQPLPGYQRGYFREVPVWVGGREGLTYPLVPVKMKEWCKRANLSDEWEQIKRDHIDYEHIHPFADGNGRTGRMFMNWQRLKIGEPVLVVWEAEKSSYYKWF